MSKVALQPCRRHRRSARRRSRRRAGARRGGAAGGRARPAGWWRPWRGGRRISGSSGIVADRVAVLVDHRQREAGALEEGADGADVGEGRDPRRGAAGHLRFGLGEGLAQFVQRLAADERGEEEAVRPQRAANLDERARQVVRPLQGEQRDDEVEACRREGQRLRVADDVGAGLDEPVEARRIRSTWPTAVRREAVSPGSGLPRSAAAGKGRLTAASRSTRSSAAARSRKSAPGAARTSARRRRASRSAWSKIDGAVVIAEVMERAAAAVKSRRQWRRIGEGRYASPMDTGSDVATDRSPAATAQGRRARDRAHGSPMWRCRRSASPATR